LEWKDLLVPGASRVPVPIGTPGSFPDWDVVGQAPMGRNDWVSRGGVEYISGSGPDPNTVSNEEWLRGISGRGNPLVGQGWGGSGPGPSEVARRAALPASVLNPGVAAGPPVVGGGALGEYAGRSAAELQALLKALSQLDFGSLLGGGVQGGGGLRIAE
jgi:hypothetical protein